MPRHDDTSLLEAALVGYQAQVAQIEGQIAQIQKRLGTASIPGLGRFRSANHEPRKKNTISAEGRARIAEAQRKRWAAVKKK